MSWSVELKRALAGLWAVPGIGPKTLDTIAGRLRLEELTGSLIGEWVEEVELPDPVAARMPRGMTLGALGDWLLERARAHRMQIAWRGEAEYPARLAEISDAPPLLFYWGPGTRAPPRRRIAMVGTRRPDALSLDAFTQIVRETARFGIGVVSGAAFGIDTLAHTRAAEAGGETWAFVGSALDQLDLHQRKLWEHLSATGATFWSELPPGVRAERQTFPRRNRLISGAADAVCVLRAGLSSGARYTVKYAEQQGRTVLAAPGNADNPKAQLCNLLIRTRRAELLFGVDDVLRAVGATGLPSHTPAPVLAADRRVDPSTLPPDAQLALAAIDRSGKCFDDLIVELGMGAGRLIAAIFELTSSGLVTEHSGRRYQRV